MKFGILPLGEYQTDYIIALSNPPSTKILLTGVEAIFKFKKFFSCYGGSRGTPGALSLSGCCSKLARCLHV